jgi:pSer/pThr/pTyr-binding forkhead associated (FHA) protein
VLDGLLFVKDLGSANGTFLNGKQIVESRVKRGDELRFDALSFGVIGPADDLAKTTVRGPINRPAVVGSDSVSAKLAAKTPAKTGAPSSNVLDKSVRTSSAKRTSPSDNAEEPVHYGKHSMAILVVLVVIVLTALYLKGG